MEIKYLKREEIDKTKWNSCVHYANHGNVFGYMWYLDQFSKEWDALVEGDYESVLPLIWKKNRLGGLQLYQPALIPHVGIYSIHVLSPKRINSFLEAIPAEFKKINIQLNERSQPNEALGFDVNHFTNHLLPLNQPFEGLEDAFDPELKQQIEQAEQEGLLPLSDLKPERLAEFYKDHQTRNAELEFNFHALQRIMWNALHRGWGFASGIANKDKQLLAVDFFIYSHGKVTSLMPTESAEGRRKHALAYLYYMMLRKNANSPLVLDFNTRGKHDIAEKMGAKTKRFYRLERDKRLLKIF
jgi:hypothetical protein